jgi:hypothetical protein
VVVVGESEVVVVGGTVVVVGESEVVVVAQSLVLFVQSHLHPVTGLFANSQPVGKLRLPLQ